MIYTRRFHVGSAGFKPPLFSGLALDIFTSSHEINVICELPKTPLLKF